MSCPGLELWDVKGCRNLVSARGILFANKQLNAEVTSAFFSNNTFMVCIAETWRYETPGQIFAYKLAPSSIAQIQHLNIVVRHDVPINAPVFERASDTIRHNMVHVVNSLNAENNHLKTLKIRVISRYAGEIETVRPQIDALLKNPTNAPVGVLRLDGKFAKLTHKSLKRFMTSAYHIMDALLALECKVGRFEIYGDLPGDVIECLCRKFNATLPEPAVNAAMPVRGSTSSANVLATAPTPQAGVAQPTMLDFLRNYATGNPNDQFAQDMAQRAANMPWFTDPAVFASLLGQQAGARRNGREPGHGAGRGRGGKSS